jgi:hypothetical protein
MMMMVVIEKSELLPSASMDFLQLSQAPPVCVAGHDDIYEDQMR